MTEPDVSDAADNVLDAPLEAAALEDLLPHREPFLFVRRLLAWAPGKWAESEVEFRGDEFFFRGHFPGRPIVPGVILVEAAAQTAGLALHDEPGAERQPGEGGAWLAKIRHWRFRQPVQPPQVLRVSARVEGRFGAGGIATVVLAAEGRVVAEGELVLSLSE